MNEEERKKILSGWAEKAGTSIEELETDFKNFFDSYKKEFADYDENTLTIKALSRVQGFYSRNFSSNAKTFDAIIIGAGSCYDPNKKERTEAKEKGYVNEDGNPLYFSQKMEWLWKDKETGEDKQIVIPGPEHEDSCGRRLYGLFKKTDEDNWKTGIVFLKGKRICNTPVPMFKILKNFRVGISDDKLAEETLIMNGASVTNYNVSNNKEIDFKGMCEALLPQNYIPFEELGTITTADELPLGVLITSGDVININMTKENVKSNAIEIMKTSKDISDLQKIGEDVQTITVWFPKDIEINTAVGSEIMVVCQKSTGTDKEGKPTSNYNGLGIYSLFNTAPAEKAKPIEPKEIVDEKPKPTWDSDGQ